MFTLFTLAATADHTVTLTANEMSTLVNAAGITNDNAAMIAALRGAPALASIIADTSDTAVTAAVTPLNAQIDALVTGSIEAGKGTFGVLHTLVKDYTAGDVQEKAALASLWGAAQINYNSKLKALSLYTKATEASTLAAPGIANLTTSGYTETNLTAVTFDAFAAQLNALEE